MLTQKEAESVLYDMKSTVGSPAMTELDRAMTPILAELMTLGPGNKEHPTAKQLFNWLVDPQRTGEEFNYVVETLKEQVFDIMCDNFYEYIFRVNYYDCVRPVAIEALAHRHPALDTSWEPAAWMMCTYDTATYDAASVRLNDWLTHVTSDPELCPNPYLRLKLVILLLDISDLKNYNPSNAIELLLHACASINLVYLLENEYGTFQGEHEVITTLFDEYEIIPKLSTLFQDSHRHAFDEKLAVKLNGVITSWLSEQPTALYGITTLLNTLAAHTNVAYKDLQKEIRSGEENENLIQRIGETVNLCHVVIGSFNQSCQTPQLISLTASCIMDVLELLFYANNRGSNDYIVVLDRVLGCLFGGEIPLNSLNSPIGIEITCQYKERLKILSKMPQDFYCFALNMSIPNITTLLQSVGH